MKILLIMVLSCTVSPLFSGISLDVNKGGAGFDILKVESGATCAALSGAVSSTNHQNLSPVCTPAAIAGDTSNRVYFSTDFLPEQFDIQRNSASLIFSGSRINTAISLSSLKNKTGIDGRDTEGKPTSDYYFSSYTTGIHLGHAEKKLGWGASLLYHNEALSHYNAHAFIVNIAVRYSFPYEISAGLLIKNFGYATSYDSSTETLPLTLQTGLSWKYSILPILASTLSMDIQKINEENISILPAASISLYSIFNVIVSLPGNTDSPVSVGAGITFKGFSIDYGLRVHNYLGNYHHFSAQIRY